MDVVEVNQAMNGQELERNGISRRCKVSRKGYSLDQWLAAHGQIEQKIPKGPIIK